MTLLMSALVAAPLALINLSSAISHALFALLSFAGIFLFFRNRQWREMRLKDFLQHPVTLTLVFLATVYVAALAQDAWGSLDSRKLEDLTWALLLMGLIPVNRHWGSRNTLWWGVITCAILSGCMAIYEASDLGIHGRAVGSKGKPIMFGDIAMMAGVLSVMAAFHFRGRGAPMALALAAAALGLFGSLQSGTRGAWLFVPVFAVLLVLLLPRFGTAVKWRNALLVTLLAAIPTLALIPMASNRIAVAVHEVQSYVAQEPHSAKTSVGQRFDMWRATLMLIREHPLTGVGVGQLNNRFRAYAAEGVVDSLTATRDHAHNEYLNTFVTRGLIGFGGLMVLLLGSGYFFYRRLARNPAAAGAGITLIAGYATFGLTESILFFKIALVFFFSCLYLLADELSRDPAV